MTPEERARRLSGEWCDCKPTPVWRSLRRSCERCIAAAIRAAVEEERRACVAIAGRVINSLSAREGGTR